MGYHDAQRRAAWQFVRAVIRSQSAGVVGAAISGVLWQVGAVAAPLMVKNAIDRGVLTHDHTALLAWLGALLFVGLLEMTAGAVRHVYASWRSRPPSRQSRKAEQWSRSRTACLPLSVRTAWQ
jgi:zinc transporter ZupT